MKIFKSMVLVFVIYSGGVWANITPDLYVGSGVVQNSSSIEVSLPGELELLTESFNNKSTFFTIGLRPLDIPIFGGLRGELQFLSAFEGENKDKRYGMVIYYDLLRFIPIINPYIGIGTQRVDYDLNNTANSLKEKNTLYTFHVGLNFGIPIFPFDMYVEHRRSITNTNAQILNHYSYKVKSSDIIVGLKYYILK